MGILSDKDIKDCLENGKLRIEPFSEGNLTPNGYDLIVEEVLIPELEKGFKEGVAEIPGKQWFLVSTKEYVRLSGEVTAQLWIRTTYARKGILASFGKVDAGFEGNLTLSAFNSSASVVNIKIGGTFAQIVWPNCQSRTPNNISMMTPTMTIFLMNLTMPTTIRMAMTTKKGRHTIAKYGSISMFYTLEYTYLIFADILKRLLIENLTGVKNTINIIPSSTVNAVHRISIRIGILLVCLGRRFSGTFFKIMGQVIHQMLYCL
jgi:dCTP deaminase